MAPNQDSQNISFEIENLCDSIDRMMHRHLPPDEVRRRDEQADPPNQLLQIYSSMGLFDLVMPSKGGERDRNCWQRLSVIQERLGYHATMAALLFNRVACFGMMTLITSANKLQQDRFLPRLHAGEGAFALALSESGAGSDAGAIRTRAERKGSNWKITGRKIWISGAADAIKMIVAARTEPNSKGGSGITLFMVDPNAVGVSMTLLEKVGNRCSLSYDIALDGVLISDEDRIGEVGGGFNSLKKTLFYARSGLSAAVVGTAQAAVDKATAHAKERKQFSKPIGSFQVIAHRLANMQTDVDVARLLARDLAEAIDAGRDCARLAAQAKLVSTETLKRVTEQGMQIMASAGYASESDMNRYWRDARLYSFGEGSSEILLDLIAADMGLGRGISL